MKQKDNKEATTLWLRPSTLEKVDAALKIAKCKSRSEFTEDALLYYVGRVVTGDVSGYVTEELREELRKAAVENENRMRSLIFRWAVELNMMCHTIAAHYRVDELDRRVLRAFAVEEVKETGGQVSFDHALDVQRGAPYERAPDSDEW